MPASRLNGRARNAAICLAALAIIVCLLGIGAIATEAATPPALSWSPPQQLAGGGEGSGWNSDPLNRFAAAEVLPEGGTFFAGASSPGIEVARTSNAGTVLATNFVLDPATGARLRYADLDIAVDDAGRVALATGGEDISLTRFAATASQPSAKFQLAPAFPTTQGLYYPRPAIALAAGGVGLVAWQRPDADGSANTLWYSQLANNAPPSPSRQVVGTGNVAAWTVQAATAPNGFTGLAWRQEDDAGRTELAWTTISPAGDISPIRTLTRPERLEAGTTQLAVGADNTFFVTADYQQDQRYRIPTTPDAVLPLVHINSSGDVLSAIDVTSFSSTAPDDTSNHHLESVILTTNTRGEALLAWQHWSKDANRNSGYVIEAIRVAADGRLGTPLAVTSRILSGGSSSPTSIALASDGTAAIGWGAFRPDGHFSGQARIVSSANELGQQEAIPTLRGVAAGVPFLLFSGGQTLTSLWSDANKSGTEYNWQGVSVTKLTGPSGSPPPEPSSPPANPPTPAACNGAEAFCLPTTPSQPSIQPTAPATDPCKGVKGNLADKLLASLECSATQTVKQAQCGISAALTIITPLKALSFSKTAHGFYDLRRASRKYKPLLGMYNKLLLTKFLPKAPKGFRTGAEVVEQLRNADDIYDVVQTVMTAGRYVSGGSGAVSGFALDLLDVFGLKTCVEALASAVE